MKASLVAIGYLLVAVFWPRFTQQGLSYQHFLWTSEWMKREYPTDGFLFRRGQVDGALMWERVRLGFPLGSTTIDYRPGDNVVQGRVETHAIFVNLVFLAPFAAGLYFFLRAIGAERRQRRLLQEPHSSAP